jgi:hypothetical protein
MRKPKTQPAPTQSQLALPPLSDEEKMTRIKKWRVIVDQARKRESDHKKAVKEARSEATDYEERIAVLERQFDQQEMNLPQKSKPEPKNARAKD